MRFRSRRGQSLIEAAVVLPVLLAATFALFAGVQVAAWKLSADAAAGAGAAVLASGGSPAAAVEMARGALSAPSALAPVITADVANGTGTVTLALVVPAVLGAVDLTAQRTVLVPGGVGTSLGSGGGFPGGLGGGLSGNHGGSGSGPVCDHVILSPGGREICTAQAVSVP